MDTSGSGDECAGCAGGLCGNISASNKRDNNSGSWVFESIDGKKDGDIVYVGDTMIIRNLYNTNGNYFESCGRGACGEGIHTRCTNDKSRPYNQWFIEYTDDYKNTKQRYMTDTGLWANI